MSFQIEFEKKHIFESLNQVFPSMSFCITEIASGVVQRRLIQALKYVFLPGQSRTFWRYKQKKVLDKIFHTVRWGSRLRPSTRD